MPRDEACLPAIDANSAEALRLKALRASQFAWNFPNEAAIFLEYGTELGRCRVWKGSAMITFRRLLANLLARKLNGPLVVGWSYRNGQRVLIRLPG